MEFINDASLSGDVSEEEMEFLRQLRPPGRFPTALYYYRELQNLRDTLNFRGLAKVPTAAVRKLAGGR